jgi:hypothetical protein
MLRVNCVTEEPGWILHRCARELADRIPGVTINGNRALAALNYYLPAYRSDGPKAGEPAVGFFTHPTEAQLDALTPRFAGHVAMNTRVAEALRSRGASPMVLRPGASTAAKPLTFGVCGRTYPKTGRKGESLVAAMVTAGFRVRAWGYGWPCPSMGDHPADLPTFYQLIDYLVIPSTTEGGPMPVVDALASGVPVIAPDVGWCWEFPCLKYERGSWASLRAVLEALSTPPTWQAWADGHRALFERLVGPC